MLLMFILKVQMQVSKLLLLCELPYLLKTQLCKLSLPKKKYKHKLPIVDLLQLLLLCKLIFLGNHQALFHNTNHIMLHKQDIEQVYPPRLGILLWWMTCSVLRKTSPWPTRVRDRCRKT